jgi:hypothetical protein
MAETGSIDFEQGNAPARIDLVDMLVKNEAKRFTVTLEVRNLRERQRGSFSVNYWRNNGQAPPARSLIIEVRQRDDAADATFFECGREDCVEAACRGLRASWDHEADEVLMSAPQRCYPRPDGVRPPRSGRFFASSRVGDTVDDARGELVLDRG